MSSVREKNGTYEQLLKISFASLRRPIRLQAFFFPGFCGLKEFGFCVLMT